MTGQLLDRTISAIAKKVKKEERNIRTVLNVSILGLVGFPSNLLFDASPSEGKTHIITNTLSVFPSGIVSILRDSSPKAFVHERGELGLKVIDEDGNVQYLTKVRNTVQNEDTTVQEYKQDLEAEEERLEKEAKSDLSKKRELFGIKRDLRELRQQLVTVINFDGTIIAFLDQPAAELLKNLLSVMSHDTFYTETMFTEGEGTKYTKHVVFRGFPAFIFAVSKDSFLNWKDIETRFEVREPNMSPEKYQAAIELSFKEMFGPEEEDSEELKEIRKEISTLINIIRDDVRSSNLTFLLPIGEKEIANTLFSNEIKHGDAMRKVPRIMNHIRANAIWNYNKRIKLLGKGKEYILVAAEDIRSLSEIYDDLELNSILSGIPVSLFEFWKDVLTPLFVKDDSGDYAEVKQSDVVKALDNYVETNKNNTKLKSGKLTVSRDLTKLEDRGLIKKVEDEKDKRSRKIITLIDPEQFVASLSTRIEELVKKISITMENGCDTILHRLLSENYSAFLDGRKLVSRKTPILLDDQIPQNDESEKACILQDVVKQVVGLSGYSPSTGGTVDTNFGINLNVVSSPKNLTALFWDHVVPFYYSGPGETVVINQSSEDVVGTYDLKLNSEDILTIPETAAKSLMNLGLGRCLTES